MASRLERPADRTSDPGCTNAQPRGPPRISAPRTPQPPVQTPRVEPARMVRHAVPDMVGSVPPAPGPSSPSDSSARQRPPHVGESMQLTLTSDRDGGSVSQISTPDERAPEYDEFGFIETY